MAEEGFKRKLTAILSADVVGYSRLMDDNEEATIRTLNAFRGSMTKLIKQHRGRVSIFFLCNSFVVTELERTGESTLAQERRSYER